MPIPAGVETVTVRSGVPLTRPDGTLYRGHIRFIAPDLMVSPSDDYTLGGEAVAELTAGEFSIVLVPQDATGLSPTGWTYTVIGEFINAPGWTQYVQLTKDSPNVVLSDVLQANSTDPVASGIYLPIAGGTLTGPLVLAADPVVPLGAATKQFVEATAVSASDEQILTTLGVDTGVISGGELNANISSPLSLDISDTVGLVANYVTDPENPTITRVTFNAATVALSDTVSPITWWMLDSAGAVVQQTTKPTNTQRRTHIQLGATASNGVEIFIDQSLPVIIPQPTNQLYDLMDALGNFNITGNILSAADANLQLAKDGGTVFSRGFNHFAGPTLTDDPHVSEAASQNPVSLRYVTRTPAAVVPQVTSVDPTKYDVGGVITSVGGGVNTSTIQRLWLFPTNDVVDQVVIQYGQTAYSNLDSAIAAIGNQSYVKNPALVDGVLIGYVVATRTCTNLSDTTKARIVTAARFSENAAGASAALSLSLLLTGGTMTGPLILAADPLVDLGAATKQYVDNASGGGVSIPFAEARIVDHDLSDMASAPTWTIVSTSAGTQLKCSIDAAIGDRLKVCPHYMFVGPHYQDLAILGLTGLPDRYDTTRTTTPPAEGAPVMYPSLSFSHVNTDVVFTATSDNIVAGQATIALVHQGTGSGFKVYAHPTYPFVLRLENWGPEPS